MKTALLFLLITTTCIAQTATYNQLKKNKQYKSYISKDGTVLHIGDTLHINPPNGNQYIYITQVNVPAGPILTNKDIIISKLKSWGPNSTEPNLYVGFKGYGLVMVYIDYENALDTGEIYNPHSKLSKYEALAILKEKKELLDLKLISKIEYDKIKAELTPIILSNN